MLPLLLDPPEDVELDAAALEEEEEVGEPEDAVLAATPLEVEALAPLLDSPLDDVTTLPELLPEPCED